MDGGESRVERGENLQEEAVPRRARKIHGDPPDTEAPKYTQSTALCYIGERHTNTRTNSRTRSFSCHRQRRETKEMHFVCPKRCENRHRLFQMQSAHLQGTYIILLSVMCISGTKCPLASYLEIMLLLVTCMSSHKDRHSFLFWLVHNLEN